MCLADARTLVKLMTPSPQKIDSWAVVGQSDVEKQ
jgi:hypothetical protein